MTQNKCTTMNYDEDDKNASYKTCPAFTFFTLFGDSNTICCEASSGPRTAQVHCGNVTVSLSTHHQWIKIYE